MADPTKNLEVAEAIRALVGRIVLTPSAGDPKVLTVDLEGVLAQLLWLGLDRANKKAAPGGAADLQSKLVAGAGYNEERTTGELRLAV